MVRLAFPAQLARFNGSGDAYADLVRDLWPFTNHTASLRASAERRWWLFFGDSTTRNNLGEMLGLISSLLGQRAHRLPPPTVGSLTVYSNDHQVDQDMIFGSTTLSLRFARGIDQPKLELSARERWRPYIYPDMTLRSSAGPSSLRSVLDVDAAPWDAFFERTLRPGREVAPHPDAVVFHSCAWETPAINRSMVHNPGRCGPSASLERCRAAAGGDLYSPRLRSDCAPPPAFAEVWVKLPRAERLARQAAGRLAADSSPYNRTTARVLTAPCVKRGEALSDDAILDGFRARLRAALTTLRAALPATTRLLVRNCHAGTAHAFAPGGGSWPPFAQFVAMNAIIADVAREMCLELIDVFAIDAAAGFYDATAKAYDIHVPAYGSRNAALATLLTLLNTSSASGATSGGGSSRWQRRCGSRGALNGGLSDEMAAPKSGAASHEQRQRGGGVSSK